MKRTLPSRFAIAIQALAWGTEHKEERKENTMEQKGMKRSKAHLWAAVGGVLASALITTAAAPAKAADTREQTKKPNIVVIWGDDIGQSDVSAYSMGLMGFHTPNIDRVAKEGVIFTDYYAEQSCTAGRASFITGQSGLRTGLTKVGLPGAAVGLQKEDPTIAELLKAQGYATG
jgi:alkaline phosphatase